MPVRPGTSGLPLGNTVGIEYETEFISPESVGSLNIPGWSGTHDASIESDYSVCRTGFPIRGATKLLPTRLSRTLVGVELVSSVYNLLEESPENDIRALTKWLSERGEPPQSYRAGVHFHIGVPNYTLDMLKSFIGWGRYLEALFFQVGGMGYEFRGVQNDSAFCRPITRSGPPVVPFRHGYVKSFDLDDMMNATSIPSFWMRYGNSNTSSPARYVPQRYIWLNFYSILAHRTLEFRVFNKSMNPTYLLACLDLCHKFTLHAITTDPPEIENSVFDAYDRGKAHILNTLQDVAGRWNMHPVTEKVLRDIINRTPLINLREAYCLSHLNSSGVFDVDAPYSPRHVDSDDVIRPAVVTIHTMRGER